MEKNQRWPLLEITAGKQDPWEMGGFYLKWTDEERLGLEFDDRY